MPEPSRQPTDRLLVLEAGLTLALIGLAVYLYLRPAAEGLRSAMWWHWMLLGVLFFGIIALHMARKRRAGRDALHHVIQEDAERHRSG